MKLGGASTGREENQTAEAGEGANESREASHPEVAHKLRRWEVGWPLLLLFLLAWPTAVGRAQPAAGEYEVKAAFLFNFAKFAEWPAEAFSEPAAPLQICVLGEDPFGAVLKRTVEGKSIRGRGVMTVRVREGQAARRCHLLFLTASEAKRTRQILEGLRGAPVLTVGETEDFCRNGGMIGLRLEDERVRFEINPDAAEAAQLRLSAKLLSVARNIVGRGTVR